MDTQATSKRNLVQLPDLQELSVSASLKLGFSALLHIMAIVRIIGMEQKTAWYKIVEIMKEKKKTNKGNKMRHNLKR